MASRADAAVRWAITAQRADGAWGAQPDPRAFETALVGFALTRVRDPRAAAAAERARAQLAAVPRAQRGVIADAFDLAPRRIWLARPGVELDLTAEHWQSSVMMRKAWMLQVLGQEAGVAVRTGVSLDLLRAMVAQMFARREALRLKRWHHAELAAMHTLLAACAGDREQVAVGAAALASEQDPDGSFSNLPLSTALGLLALSSAGAGAAFDRCLSYLLDAQQPDGTWRFCTNEVWDTTLMLRVFSGVPEFDELAARPAGEFLLRWQNTDGGWGFRAGVQSDNDSASCAILALADVPDARHAVARGARYLDQQRLPTGLWSTWQDATDEPCDDVLAHVLCALGRVGLDASRSARDGLENAVAWLRARAEVDEAWAGSWYRNEPYARHEICAAFAVGHPLQDVSAAALERTQNDDGGWGCVAGEPSAASATGLAVSALLRCRGRESVAAGRGVAWLCAAQRADGSWNGVPEMYGPRPMISHYQTQTHALASRGLVQAWRAGL